MQRIYHHYELWECWKNGFWDSASGTDKKDKIQKVVDLFSDPQNTTIYMNRVIKECPYACEQNLSNDNMNKVAWLGQAACCLLDKIPSSVTMEAWSLVPDEFKTIANNIAESIIKEWEENYE